MISKDALGHFLMSIIKSVLRITGGIMFLCTRSMELFMACFVGAEVLGIFEEVFDKR